MEFIDVKVRKVGNSLGIILPRNVVEMEGIHNGETVRIAVLKKRTHNFEELLGLTAGAPSFERDHTDRV